MRCSGLLSTALCLGLACACASSQSDAPPDDPADGIPDPPASAGEVAAPPASVNASGSVVAPAASASAATSPSPPAGPCPDDMVDVQVACIDRYEAPNEKGKKPILMQSSADGEKWCAERGKRLCDEDEWVRACQGPKGQTYPYGNKFEPGRCNDDGVFRSVNWKLLGSWPSEAATREVEKLDQSNPSGQREGCVSPEGVFDLTGNVAEWVVRTRKNETNYSHVVKGCFWGRCFRVPHEPACDYVNFAHPAGFRSYEMGIRCCKARSAAP